MKLISIGCLALLSFLTVHSQHIHDSLLIDGHYRVFHFSKPQSSKAGGSLVFVLHGSGGDGQGMMARTAKLEEQSRNENLVLVYPDGYKKYWNECRKASTAAANLENIDENGFFAGMISYFAEKYAINTKQVFAVGTSGGGHMAYKLALTMPQKFRAIAAIIANLPDSANMDCSAAGLPISVMIVNGTQDPVNPYNGGKVVIPGVVLGTVRSTENTFHYWSRLDGYKGEPVKALLADTDPSDGKTIERYTFSAKGKPEVVLLKVIGGKHDYPNDIDVHAEAWAFFKRQISRKIKQR
ncbi:MAG: poly(3-hydroxybutyrate) depolymerase [Chitinophagaceae bacterium]|nr:poly(3-hydroxybutyrate) depolymerase [Chitinophagaceae bacterium]